MLAALRNRLWGSRTEKRLTGLAPFSLEVRRDGDLLFSDRFEPGELVIGGGPAADVIIADLDSEEAALLRLEGRGVSGLIHLTALDPEVVVPGRSGKAGDPIVFLEQAHFTVADYDFHVLFEAPTGLIPDKGSLPIILFFLAGLAGLAAVVSGHGGGTRSASAPPPPPTSQPDKGPASQEKRVEFSADQLRRRLVAANLLPPVRVWQRGDSLVLTGVLSADERARILDLLAAIRSNLPAAIELEIMSDSDVAGFVSSVALAPQIYLMGRDNKRYEVGHALPDGGILESITASSLTVNRDGIKEKIVFTR